MSLDWEINFLYLVSCVSKIFLYLVCPNITSKEEQNICLLFFERLNKYNCP